LTGNSRLPSLGPRGEGWFALQVVLLVAIAAAGFIARVGSHGLVILAGGALILLGLAVGFRGVRDLDRSLSPLPRPSATAELVEHGVYRRVRHPIYTGVILAAVGWSIATMSPLALVLSALLAVLLDLKSRREEAWLRERFAGYAEYARRTKRFIPGLY
jgi:protein-S-isoprenylcysteine O-methyltransferase Ste14